MRKIALLFLLLPIALPATNLAAQEWSAEQQEVLDWVNGLDWVQIYAEAVTSKAVFHPQFTAWHYADEVPSDREVLALWFGEFASEHASVRMKIKPHSIEVAGDLAILHTTYHEVVTDTTGATSEFSGRWTATAARDGGEWRFLGWTWLQTEPWPFSEGE